MKRNTRHQIQLSQLRPVHPFPARMAPDIALSHLRSSRKLKVLDPMAGSGTSVLAAGLLNHKAIGFDRDPLALLIAKTWCSEIDGLRWSQVVSKTLTNAKRTWRKSKPYPPHADGETKQFLRYWFDLNTRKKLSALAAIIRKTKGHRLRNQLWCAFSRLIVVKDNGVSLARDTAHSRPHRVYEVAPVDAFDLFPKAGNYILRILQSLPDSNKGIRLMEGDARKLPVEAASVDVVLTSPPYLNAIDYLRGHRMSLVWIGFTLNQLRELRSESIGGEIGIDEIPNDLKSARRAMGQVEGLPPRTLRIVNKYVVDMNAVVKEIRRVLRPTGRAVVVIGNSTLRGVFLKNSSLIVALGQQHGLELLTRKVRQIPASKRYLPPPTSRVKTALSSRMRTELVLTFKCRGM